MIQYRLLLFIIAALALLCGCGYRLGGGGALSEGYTTISIPYAGGDLDGNLTAAIIKEITATGCFEYRRDGGALSLQVKILDIYDENIDFRYDRHKDGRIKQTIIPTETRITAVAEVAVVEMGSGCTLLGPAKIAASVDFDHDFYKSRNGINVFSLGQLTDYDEAQDAAERPLNIALARKIADFVCDSW